MKNTITILFLIIHVASVGQGQTTDMVLTSDSDTTFWLTNQQEKIDIFNLYEIEDVKGDFVFRSWTPKSLIEVVKNGKEIKGTITFFVINAGREDRNEVFVQEYQIPAFSAELLYKLITGSEFNNIPSDKYIKDWWQGMDGVNYIFEQKDKTSYSFKHYWSPYSHIDLKEADFILEFRKELENIAELGQNWEKFQKEMPFLSYTYFGASYSVHKVLTKKELRKYKKEQNTKERKYNKR